MYLKENSISDVRDHTSACNLLIRLSGLFLFMQACTVVTLQQNGSRTQQDMVPRYFNAPIQIVNSPDVGSIALYRQGTPESLPVIELASDEQLTLTFDLLEFEARTLHLEFVHHTREWVPSPLSPDSYMEGLQRIYLPFGTVSASRPPLYRTYHYTFPDEQFGFTKSGNYSLRVTDSDTGFLLFSLPFFVHENEGSVTGLVRSPSASVRKRHIPAGRYALPDFITQPSFDLHFQFIQNRFLGRSIKNPQTGFPDENFVYAEAPEQPVILGDYEFMNVNLTPLSISNPQISAFEPAAVPMRVSLTDDTDAFHGRDGRYSFSTFGAPLHSENAPYVEVTFTLDSDPDLLDGEIYLVGDFTNWAIQNDKKLVYSEETDRWQTTAFIKEGRYAYKYILMRDGQIDDLYFDSRFSRGTQEYLMMVYMSDNREFYDRLLQYGQFYSND